MGAGKDLWKDSNYLDAPAFDGFAITPSDTVDFDTVCRAIYIGTGGDISFIAASGNTVVLKNTVAGTVMPFRMKRINSTGTTAADLVGLY